MLIAMRVAVGFSAATAKRCDFGAGARGVAWLALSEGPAVAVARGAARGGGFGESTGPGATGAPPQPAGNDAIAIAKATAAVREERARDAFTVRV
jgi:hypothetical protein